ncbi:MAG: ABC transporter ATP-binding protein [Pseudomonadota bacterium]
MSGAVITLDGVTKRYGSVLGLNDVSLAVAPGITGLIGPNGAGKTTFLRLVTGMLRASSGRSRVLDGDVWRDTEVRRRLGYCPDGERIWDWMSGLTFVSSMGVLSGLTPAESRRRGEERLAELELTDAMNKPISQYSRGMRQKVKLAQAVLHDPELLILDEPLNGVDPLSRHQILSMLKKRSAAGASVLISSHVLHELDGFVDRVILLQRGRLLAEGSVASIRELMDDHPHSIRLHAGDPRALARAVLGVDGVVSADLGLEGVLDVKTRNPAAFYAALPSLAAGVTEMYPLDSDLESVFRYLVKGGAG